MTARTPSLHTPTLFATLLLLLFASPLLAQTYQLVWQDEFDGTQLDLDKWEPQIGTGCPDLCGWGNNELQYYRSQNASVANGLLTITARRESFAGSQYTSARLRTRNKGDWTYGRIEVRAKMPIGQGLWPAIWMLPTDSVYGTWAASGEIDIVEYLGQDPDRVFGTLHFGGTFPQNQFSSRDYTLPSGDFHSEFHDFAIEWDATEMRWFVDGVLYATQTQWFSTAAPYPAPFDERFHLLLNLAVGGNLPGSPDGSTVFPQQFVVDYVRVYEQVDDCSIVFDGMDHASPFTNGWFVFNGSTGGGSIGANLTNVPEVVGGRASLDAGWGGSPGFVGGFGRRRPMDLRGFTHFSFWIDPDAGQDYVLELNLQDDDNGDNEIPNPPDGADDEFQYALHVSPTGPGAISGGGWQRISIPLDDFVDDPTFHYGGNGVFDPVPVGDGGNGMLVNIVVAVIAQDGAGANFRTDRWAFTRQTASIAGRVFDDADGDGILDAGESGFANVAVELIDESLDTVVATTLTSTDGAYLFEDLLAANYRVRIDASALPAGALPTVDPDGTSTAAEYALDLACDVAAADLHFGYTTSITDAPAPVRSSDQLRQNTPNPFNPTTMIEFELAQAGPVRLVVHDAAGRRIATLLDGTRNAGVHRVQWDGRDAEGSRVASGVYFYSMRTEREQSVRRMVLVE
jgi:beta-glucanase (GH16 family)